MNLKEYIQELNDLLEDNPELGECKLISSDDDEGNGYKFVTYAPDIRYVDKDSKYYIESAYSEDDLDKDELSDYLKVVIIN